jgi:hypothetical protein
VNDLLTIAIETPFDGTAEMRILNIDGQTLKQQDIPVSQGPNHMNQSTSDLPTGVYMVHIQYEGTILTQKFVKM